MSFRTYLTYKHVNYACRVDPEGLGKYVVHLQIKNYFNINNYFTSQNGITQVLTKLWNLNFRDINGHDHCLEHLRNSKG